MELAGRLITQPASHHLFTSLAQCWANLHPSHVALLAEQPPLRLPRQRSPSSLFQRSRRWVATYTTWAAAPCLRHCSSDLRRHVHAHHGGMHTRPCASHMLNLHMHTHTEVPLRRTHVASPHTSNLSSGGVVLSPMALVPSKSAVRCAWPLDANGGDPCDGGWVPVSKLVRAQRPPIVP